MIKQVLKSLLFITGLIASMVFLPAIFLLIINHFIPGINSVILETIVNILFLIVLILFFKKSLIKDFKEFKKSPKQNIVTGLKYWLVGILVMFVSNIIINVLVFPGNIAENETLVREMIFNNKLLSAFSMILIAPITEELIFRAGFRKAIKNDTLFVLLSGLIFGFFHVIVDLNPITKLLYIIPYGSLGCAFAYMNVKTDNVYTSIIIHAFHNALTFSLLVSVLG